MIIQTHALVGSATQLKGLQIFLAPYAQNVAYAWWVVFCLVVICVLWILVRSGIAWYADTKKGCNPQSAEK